MRVQRSSVSVLALVLALAGCGGGGGGTPAPSGNFSTGVTRLESLYAGEGDARVLSAEAVSALAPLRNQSARAALAFSAAETADAVNELLALFGETVRSENRESPVIKVVKSLSLVSAGRKLRPASPYALVGRFPTAFGAPTGSDGRSYPDSPNHGQVEAAVRRLLARLRNADAVLSEARANQAEAEPLVLRVREGGETRTYRLGKAELLGFRGALKAVEGSLEFLLSWDLNPRGFEDKTLGEIADSVDNVEGAAVPLSEVLPSDRFGRLQTRQGLVRFLADWREAGAALEGGLEAYRARPAGADFALNDADLTNADVTDAEAYVDRFRDALEGTVAIPELDGDRLNIPGFVANPPSGLSQLLPGLRLREYTRDGNSTFIVLGFDDTPLTFGGLYPDGVNASDLLRDFRGNASTPLSRAYGN